MFDLKDCNWKKVLENSAKSSIGSIFIICPFIKFATLKDLLSYRKYDNIQVLTRFNLRDFYQNVNDISALRELLKQNSQVRGIKNLHSKLYIFGSQSAIVTSANLTEMAMVRNKEFGFVTDDQLLVKKCNQYFDDLWKQAGTDLRKEDIDNWEIKLNRAKLNQRTYKIPDDLTDEGIDIGFTDISYTESTYHDLSVNAYIKFFGQGNERHSRNKPIIELLKYYGSHYACSYPKDKRPRKHNDGDIMFIGQLSKDPDDIIIYGRGIANKYVKGRDDANDDEIKKRPWKDRWPHYIRIHNVEFINGILGNGISLNKLKETLKELSFETTKNRSIAGKADINPNLSIRNQPDVQLSYEAFNWLTLEFEAAIKQYGIVDGIQLAKLDQPVIKQLNPIDVWCKIVDNIENSLNTKYQSFTNKQNYDATYDSNTRIITVKREQGQPEQITEDIVIKAINRLNMRNGMATRDQFLSDNPNSTGVVATMTTVVHFASSFLVWDKQNRYIAINNRDYSTFTVRGKIVRFSKNSYNIEVENIEDIKEYWEEKKIDTKLDWAGMNPPLVTVGAQEFVNKCQPGDIVAYDIETVNRSGKIGIRGVDLRVIEETEISR